VSKPPCSKSGNSETYLVCKEFKGIDEEILETLLMGIEKDLFKEKALIDLSILTNKSNEMIYQQAITCGLFFGEAQRSTIQYNLDTFPNHPERSKVNLFFL